MSVSERIISRRNELGLSQTDLAKRAGLKPPAISQYESETRNPSYEALIKLSNALDVTTDYLISGTQIKSDMINEKTAKILINIIQSMSVENREQLLMYASFLMNLQIMDFGVPTLNGPAEYADYVYKNFCDNMLPVDVYEISQKIGISVYKDYIENEYEGLLIKNSGKCVVILNNSIDFEPRIKFTLSMLIGHALIPWHLKSNYYIRKKGTSTLHTEDPHEIEAQEFAAHLLMPKIHFMKDLIKEHISMKEVKEIADNKYHVSVTSFLNHMVDCSNERFGWVQSNAKDIIKVHQGNRPIVETINENSIAYSFYKVPMPQDEEIRDSEVPASYWFSDADKNETVFESSIYNPKYGNVLTLLSARK
jgi:transcriptional regulator with XRE-family HTH domain/uncharacterized protein YkvS